MKRLFEENTICRLCLRFDDKAYKLNNSNHKAFIESIIRVKKKLYILPDDLYVCYICNTFVAKCFNFARTLWIAQEMIDVILKTTDIITKPLLDGIDRDNNGLNPITLSSVVIHENNFTNDSNYDGHASAVEIDIEEVNLNDLVEKPENQTKQNQEHKKKRNINETQNYLHSNSSSDENEETVACNLDEEEVEIGNIDIETSDIFADNLNEDACAEPKPNKIAVQDIAEKIRKTFSLSKIKVKNESSTANENECKKKGVEFDEYCLSDSTNSSTGKITKPLLDGIDRHNNGLIPITLSSVVRNGNNFTNDSNNDGHTSTDIEEVDLDDLVDNLKNNTKKNRECKEKRNLNKPKNYLRSNSSSDENEEIVACNLDEEEVEIGSIDLETSNIFADNLIEDACDEPKPKKLTSQDIAKRFRKTLSLSKIKVKNESSTANEKERMKKSVKIDEDYLSDSTNSSTANEGKRKKKRDEDYRPDSTSHSEDSEYDSYDDEGKRIRRPKDTRVYPMQCDHCDFVVPEKRVHYHHYINFHPDVEYPYSREKDAACTVCGKLFPRIHIRRHEDVHNLTQNFKCTFCPKVFPNKRRWYRHVRSVHPKKKYKCDYCSKEFKTKSDLRRHIRTHTGSKPFKCHICGEGFAHSGNRIIHIRIKHQNYKYKLKDDQKAQKKRKKNKRNNKEVYDTSDDEPLIRAATNPLNKSKTPLGDSNVSPNEKSTKQGPIQMVSENQKQNHKRKRKSK